MIFCYFLNIKSRSLMHRMANATRSDGERNPIGRRTEPDRTADGIGDENITFGSSDFVLRQFPYTCYLWH